MYINFPINDALFLQYFTTQLYGTEVLLPAEKAYLANITSEERIQHFNTGRYCARQALNNLNIFHVSIRKGPDGEPVWPAGIVGSISHSKHLAGAVVARADKLLSIGMDIETIGDITPQIWDTVFVETEQQFLKNFKGDDLALYSTLLFSGKESFYKLQHPLTKTFLDFTDVEISRHGSGFGLKMRKQLGQQTLLPEFTPIHFATHGKQLITLCYLANEQSAQ